MRMGAVKLRSKPVPGHEMAEQLSILDGAPTMPRGFRCQSEIISPEWEDSLLEEVRRLPFREFEFHGYTGKRRVVSYGWRYDFNDGKLLSADPIPSFLLPLRELAGGFAGREPEAFEQALVIEYGVGAPIGWHRDRPVFGDVVGISLLSACLFRLRRRAGPRWERASIRLEPRSGYVLQGEARSEWEHSIPPAETPRYSITFRTLRRTGS